MPDASPQALDLVIFGGNGDLTMRKLLPALYICHRDDNLPPATRILCVGRQDFGESGFNEHVQAHARPFVDESVFEQDVWSAFMARVQWVQVDAKQSDTFPRLAEVLAPDTLRIFFLATASNLFVPICENLQQAGCVLADSRVLIEKPLGKDLASAQAINEAVGQIFDESRIYSNDH